MAFEESAQEVPETLRRLVRQAYPGDIAAPSRPGRRDGPTPRIERLMTPNEVKLDTSLVV